MSLPILKVFERWSSKHPHHSNNLATVLIIGGMVLILFLTIASFALTSSGEQFDDDDAPFFEIGSFSGFHNDLYFGSLQVGLELGILFVLLRLEFLKSHIGEKRPSPAARSIEIAPSSCLMKTALARLCSVVFLIPSAPLLASVGNPSLVFVRGRSTRSRPRNVSNLFKEVFEYA